jgi:hypothetical protein
MFLSHETDLKNLSTETIFPVAKENSEQSTNVPPFFAKIPCPSRSFTFCCACGTMMGASSWPVNTSSLFPTLNTVDLFFREGLKKNPLPPPAPLLPAASSAPSRSSLQCCGIVTIFYSSGSGSDF